MTSEILRVKTILGGWIGGPGLSQMYFSPTIGVVLTPTDCADAAAAVRTFWLGLISHQPNAWTATVEPVVQVLEATTGALLREVAITPPAVVTGTAGGSFGPTAVGALASWHTSGVFNGRLVRGRTFVNPTGAGEFTSSGRVSAGMIAAVQAVGAALLATATPIFTIWHRPTLGGANGGIAEVTGCTVSDTESILRSRRD